MTMPEQSRDERLKAHRVSEARRLLDEPLLNEALDRLEKAAIEEMIKLPFWAGRRMRMLADRIRVIRGLRSQLTAVIINGEQALKKPLRLA
jgi:hypothetical protein